MGKANKLTTLTTNAAAAMSTVTELSYAQAKALVEGAKKLGMEQQKALEAIRNGVEKLAAEATSPVHASKLRAVPTPPRSKL